MSRLEAHKADEVVCIEETGLTIRDVDGLSARRRTTVPKRICEALGLKDKGKIRWILLKDGTLFVEKQ